MADETAPESTRLRIRREASGAAEWFRSRWQTSRRFRIGGYILGAFLALYAIVWVTIIRTLPSAESLLTYQPPLPTMVRGVNGEIVNSYARERRVQLRFVDFPKPVMNAFLAAEDKTFWSHGGVDYTGLVGAVFDYVLKFGSGERARGGSTITQQVAKNILIGDEYSITRKFKEMVVARRIESVLNKQQILELYLNEIPLGRQSFGVEAASLAYFGKDVDQLALNEAAFLAILPKAPERYGRPKFAQLAVERRNWVLEQMVSNGWATREQADAAKAQPLGIIQRRVENYDPSTGYFVEEVRRRLVDKYGDNAKAGPNSVYAGGLWVRTSLDPQLQKATQDALRAAMLRYHGGRGWVGPIDHLDITEDKWLGPLVAANHIIHYQDWRVGVVITRDGPRATIGFADGSTAPLVGFPTAIKVGDVTAAAPSGNAWAVRAIPEVSGGMLFQDPGTGRVLAMQGGFDAGLGDFNRATQALRQPGSTIKPFVYGTGLDFGMTPATMVPDQSFCVYQGAKYGKKCFRNFGGAGGSGIHTMRWGLEQSRNLMTVHIANNTGMDRVAKTIERVGIGKYEPYLAFALGAGDTTVAQMVNAYAALANNGVQFNQSLIDFVQDRNGKVIWRADERRCDGCNMAEWDGKAMPRFAPRGREVMDPRTAYQVVHMLEGVVSRGTAITLNDLGVPLFGKTGTSTGPTNVWFVGGNQEIIGGVYLGYDQPRSMGGYAQGGTMAAPIFKQVVQASKPRWSKLPFVAPKDVYMVKVDRVSGKQVFGGNASNDGKAQVIWEAFKAEAELREASREDKLKEQRDALVSAVRRVRQASAPKAGSATPDAPAERIVEEQVSVD
ncbi:MAG: penicillin-binding protein 1A [Novosphingobium sp.]